MNSDVADQNNARKYNLGMVHMGAIMYGCRINGTAVGKLLWREKSADEYFSECHRVGGSEHDNELGENVWIDLDKAWSAIHSMLTEGREDMPTGPERTDIEVAQARDVDVECLAVWLNPTVPGVRHDGSGGAALGQATAPGLSLLSACDPVDPLAVNLLGSELQLETLAHHAGKKATHRVLLPAGCLHPRVDRRTCRRLQHRDDTVLFGACLAIWPLRLAGS
jgi:hypothetical protein